MKTTKYQELDEKGRLIFQGYCMANQWCRYNKSSKYEYSTWDVSYYSANTKVIGEVKMRNKNSDDFSTWILEEKKLLQLQKLRDKMLKKQPRGANIRIHYINIFEDGQILIWDITDLNTEELEVYDSHLPQTFVHSQTLISKGTIYLKTSQAIINTKK